MSTANSVPCSQNTMALAVSTALLRLAALYIMKWGYDRLSDLPNAKAIGGQRGGYFQFLTIQGLVLAWVTIFLALISDLFHSVSLIRTVKRKLLMISLPVATVVASVFWTLNASAPHLLLPSESPSASATPSLIRAPLPVDLALHAIPSLAMVFEFFFREEAYTKYEIKKNAWVMAVSFTTWYSGWVEYLASINKRYPYPFLEAPVTVRIGIYIGAATFGYFSFRVLNSLHRGKPLLKG
ncbi:FAR-17a/AIG1-like protein [Cantharellus anzutake]|uniref:FAR-17a/AIG1-like protein n=1 Tax=Cantharellus anzutake TaxID=1750568 RepID=UPI00190691BA|nr:FAR-17a/AIG1-like protein [Cantharellus anzutake]KAF8334045.1 FAR-17a/AIG1-like protein [Cantharellus anzutake]